MIRRVALLTILLALTGAEGLVQLPDFRGTWQLDREASRITTPYGLAGLRSPAPETLYIQQTSNGTLVLASRLPGAVPRTYEFEGNTWLQAVDYDPTTILMSSRVRGLSMVSTGGGVVNGEAISVREILQIASNGRSLTLQVSTTRGSVTETNQLVYRRAGGR